MEEKLFYKIRDIAELVGETPSTLRYWESEFKELNPARGPKGRRLYTHDNLDTIRKIKFLLRDKGMHIAAAKEQLLKNSKNVTTKTRVLRELEEVREDLARLLSSLTKIK